MPDTMNVREVVKVIREKLEDAVYDHDLSMLAEVYNLVVLRSGDTDEPYGVVAFRNYFMVEE
jgi:hypothetical protein